MNRREFMQRMFGTAVSLVVQPTIIIPDFIDTRLFTGGVSLSHSKIIAAEMARILPHMKTLFDRDDVFYRLMNRESPIISSRNMRIPLKLDDK